jgi:DNA-binding XRE family transcriptional regulator
MSEEEELSNAILRFRVANNLTQEEFATKCGISRCSVVLAEKGTKKTTKKMRTKILLFIENY